MACSLDHRVVWLIWAILLPLGTPCAQTPAEIDNARRQSGEVIREQRDRDIRLLEEMQHEQGTAIEVPLLEEPEEPAVAGPCHPIHTLTLTGTTRLTSDEIAELNGMVVDKCIRLSDINRLIRRITNLYIARGFITTRALIPEQDLSSGRLEIFILEGEIENIEESGEGTGINIDTAFPGLAGDILNLRDIEQGLDQINRLQSNDARLRLEPGSKPGQSLVFIDNTVSRRLTGSLSGDNFDGDEKINARLGYDNALGLNDHISIGAVKDTAFDRGEEFNESLSLFAVVPYGYWTFSGLGSYFRYRDSIDGFTQPLQTDGRSRTHRLEVQRTVYRTPKGRVVLSSALEHRNSRNFIEDVFIETSSPRLTHAELGVSVTLPLAGGVLVSSLGVSRGLTWFGAAEDSNHMPDDAPRAQATSYDLAALFSYPIKIGALRVDYLGSFGGQYTDEILFSSRQISITGFYGVRGLRGSVVAADRGMYLRNELSVSLPGGGLRAADRVLENALPGAGFRVFTAFDAGKTYEHFGEKDQFLSSWSVGLGGGWRGASFSVTHSGLIQDGTLNNQADNQTTYVQLVWAL